MERFLQEAGGCQDEAREFAGGGKAAERHTYTPENEGKYQNDIWQQAGYKGYFDGDWYFEKDKVMQAAKILLDETKLNEGLNLKKLQEDKTKRELFKTLLYLLNKHPAEGKPKSRLFWKQ